MYVKMKENIFAWILTDIDDELCRSSDEFTNHFFYELRLNLPSHINRYIHMYLHMYVECYIQDVKLISVFWNIFYSMYDYFDNFLWTLFRDYQRASTIALCQDCKLVLVVVYIYKGTVCDVLMCCKIAIIFRPVMIYTHTVQAVETGGKTTNLLYDLYDFFLHFLGSTLNWNASAFAPTRMRSWKHYKS